MLSQRGIFSAGAVLAGLIHVTGVMPCYADIQPDNTVGTQVSANAMEQLFQISGGSSIDRNLLHSFLNFSVKTGWIARFQLPNNTNILNVIARVTGADVSNINGTLAIDNVGYPVNLFLINPNGIIFGPNATLDLSGSFIASTAESVNFSSGYRFGMKDSASPSSVLTLGVPVGLQFGANPGPIVGQFTEPGSGLILASEKQTLALVGGAISLQGHQVDRLNRFDIPSILAAFDGRLEIASVGEGATVALNTISDQQSLVLDFSKVNNFKDLEIGNGLILGSDFSDIFLQGRQIRLSDNVQVSGPIDPGLKRGFVSINASEFLELVDSNISPVTFSSTAQGSIKIQAKQLFLKENSFINASTNAEDAFNLGQAGNISIQADRVFLDRQSLISTSSFSSASAGKIEINAKSLSLNQGSEISSSVSGNGSGAAGTIEIFSRSIVLDNNSSIHASSNSGIGGDIQLTLSDSLVLRNQSNISTSSTTTGNGGNINILVGVIAAVPTEDSNISTDAVFGNGGSINITTQGLFGIYPNTENFPDSSDITARSRFGVDGTIDTNILSTNPVVNFAVLPAVLDRKILETTCFDSRRSDRDSFIYSGLGGLPATPSDPAQSSGIWQDLRPAPMPSSQENSGDRRPSNPPSSAIPTTPIVEARGWVFGPNGSVRLVANSANSTHPAHFSQTQPCQTTQGPDPNEPLISAPGS
ncbi:filamentous hemagglutinin N-terminal domain-containing protein [Altericista sp. CCNU0014]|uniref:filamentous hemagglutinin N-terminal domain-containing protein n=1 Tax=Altericista sp. CCNU0014 TaxID=3082949 RepID=UPI00384FF08A